MKSHPNTKAHIALFISQVIYSISFVVVKIITNGYIPAFGLVTLRALVVAPMFWLTGSIFIKEKTDKRDLPKLLLLAVLAIAINQMIFVKGLSFTSPISAAIMMITSPILVLVIAAIVLKERITFLKTFGIVLGFAGAAVLMLNSGFSASNGLDNPFGDLLIFISASAWGAYLVFVKPLMKKYHTVTILKWVFTLGFILVLPFGYKELKEVPWSSFSSTIWLYILFIVVANTYVAYLLNVYALNALSPSVVSTYIYLQPLLTAVIAISTGQDAVNGMKVLAALLIFAGVYLASTNRKRKNVITESGSAASSKDNF